MAGSQGEFYFGLSWRSGFLRMESRCNLRAVWAMYGWAGCLPHKKAPP